LVRQQQSSGTVQDGVHKIVPGFAILD
jgi:hypothetical protein